MDRGSKASLVRGITGPLGPLLAAVLLGACAVAPQRAELPVRPKAPVVVAKSTIALSPDEVSTCVYHSWVDSSEEESCGEGDGMLPDDAFLNLKPSSAAQRKALVAQHGAACKKGSATACEVLMLDSALAVHEALNEHEEPPQQDAQLLRRRVQAFCRANPTKGASTLRKFGVQQLSDLEGANHNDHPRYALMQAASDLNPSDWATEPQRACEAIGAMVLLNVGAPVAATLARRCEAESSIIVCHRAAAAYRQIDDEAVEEGPFEELALAVEKRLLGMTEAKCRAGSAGSCIGTLAVMKRNIDFDIPRATAVLGELCGPKGRASDCLRGILEVDDSTAPQYRPEVPAHLLLKELQRSCVAHGHLDSCLLQLAIVKKAKFTWALRGAQAELHRMGRGRCMQGTAPVATCDVVADTASALGRPAYYAAALRYTPCAHQGDSCVGHAAVKTLTPATKPWLEAACASSSEACRILAGQERHGFLFSPSTEKAANWLAKAAAVDRAQCANKDAESCLNLAHAKQNSCVPAAPGEATATALYERACKLGMEESCDILTDLEEQ